MKQNLHLSIVDRERAAVLVTVVGGRWLLPILNVPEHVRAGPVVLNWLRQRGVTGKFAGQWLGRASPGLDAVDWLTVVRGRAEGAPPGGDSPLQWTPLEALRSRLSCVEYQQWALGACTGGRMPFSVPGPFGNLTWIDELEDWLLTVMHSRATSAVVPHRATAWEVVLEVQTSHQRQFVKGLSSDRAREASITIELSQIAPDSFARTHALARRADGSVWWSMDACPGSALAETGKHARLDRVGVALGRVQQRVAERLSSGGTPALSRLDLPRVAIWATALLAEQTEPNGEANRSIEEQCERVAHRYPESWVAADLDPGNLIVDGGNIRFIDLDDSLLGPAPLAAAVLARRAGRSRAEQVPELYAAYERAWEPRLDIHDWRHLDAVAILLIAYLAWNRVELKSTRGEIFVPLHALRALVARRMADRLQANSGGA